MRIISKYRDYYDTIQKMGYDSNLVYIRNTNNEVVYLSDVSHLNPIYNKLSKLHMMITYINKNLDDSIIHDFYIIGFCG